VQARNEQDAKLLSRLLTALGFEKRDREGNQARVEFVFPPAAALEISERRAAGGDADLTLTVSDPDSVAKVIRGMGLEISDHRSSSAADAASRQFRVRLPGGSSVAITGSRVSHPTGYVASALAGGLSATGLRFAIVAPRFNSFIVERLLLGALDALHRSGADDQSIAIVRVPGSFEVPAAARSLAESKRYDAIVCLGCLLRGDTAHYDVIVNEVTRGIGQSAQETGIPHAFGVLTCDTLEQAIDRAGLKMGNKGFEAALAAIEMANLNKNLHTRHQSGKTTTSRSANSAKRHSGSANATKRSALRKRSR
jgi:6,7-dimethyl-8-ribityllumazine synthase